MDFVVALFKTALFQTLVSLSHNWPYLVASIVIAGALKVFMDADKVSAFLNRFRGIGVLAATGAAVATPLCSCGTTAVVLGMMASTMPWAPIVAFMVASPLSSPEGIVYGAGLFGWPFAVFYFLASIVLGLTGGAAAAALQKAGLLEGQLRFAGSKGTVKASCSCAAAPGIELRPATIAVPALAPDIAPSATARTCGCSASATTVPNAASTISAAKGLPYLIERSTLFARAVGDVSRTILPIFIGFAFLGYLLNGLIPASLIGSLFGSSRAYGVPLAATIGLPLYISSEASIPLARALLDSGMSQGAIMAFLIAGSGTSLGAIGGALTIARWKIVALVIAVLWLGAIAVGYAYNELLALGFI